MKKHSEQQGEGANSIQRMEPFRTRGRGMNTARSANGRFGVHRGRVWQNGLSAKDDVRGESSGGRRRKEPAFEACRAFCHHVVDGAPT